MFMVIFLFGEHWKLKQKISYCHYGNKIIVKIVEMKCRTFFIKLNIMQETVFDRMLGCVGKIKTNSDNQYWIHLQLSLSLSLL